MILLRTSLLVIHSFFQLTSPPYLHHPTSPTSPRGTISDTSSNNYPAHTVWQSTKICHPSPPPMMFIDIPLTSVDVFLINLKALLNFNLLVASHKIKSPTSLFNNFRHFSFVATE